MKNFLIYIFITFPASNEYKNYSIMFKKLQLLFGMIILSTICLSFTQKYTAVDKGRALEEPEWKNLKILPQSISDDDLKGIMRGFNDALGVKCNHCHAVDPATDKMDFSRDDKKAKEFARHMMTMTKEINGRYFGWKNEEKPEAVKVVTCFTCHNGGTKPATQKVNLSVIKEAVKPTDVKK